LLFSKYIIVAIKKLHAGTIEALSAAVYSIIHSDRSNICNVIKFQLPPLICPLICVSCSAVSAVLIFCSVHRQFSKCSRVREQRRLTGFAFKQVAIPGWSSCHRYWIILLALNFYFGKAEELILDRNLDWLDTCHRWLELQHLRKNVVTHLLFSKYIIVAIKKLHAGTIEALLAAVYSIIHSDRRNICNVIKFQLPPLDRPPLCVSKLIVCSVHRQFSRICSMVLRRLTCFAFKQVVIPGRNRWHRYWIILLATNFYFSKAEDLILDRNLDWLDTSYRWPEFENLRNNVFTHSLFSKYIIFAIKKLHAGVIEALFAAG